MCKARKPNQASMSPCVWPTWRTLMTRDLNTPLSVNKAMNRAYLLSPIHDKLLLHPRGPEFA